MGKRWRLPDAQQLIKRARSRLGIVEVIVRGRSVEVIEPDPPEDVVEHLYEGGQITEDERRAAHRFMLLRRAVIGREHVRATKLAPKAGRSPRSDDSDDLLEDAYDGAKTALHDAGAAVRDATVALVVDNKALTGTRLADAQVGLATLALHFAKTRS